MASPSSTVPGAPVAPHHKWYQHLYTQVLCAIVLGVLLGHFYPALGAQMKPLGDLFIKLIKMLIAPIIFCTVVHGIASMEDMKKVGRVGLKSLLYFEAMTTLALVVGLVIVNLWQPGAGMNVDPAALDTRSIQSYTAARWRAVHPRLLHAYRPQHRRRRLCRRRDPTGTVFCDTLRFRAARSRRAWQAADPAHRPDSRTLSSRSLVS